MRTFDAIVIGLGATGSATTYPLARCRLKVLGIERFGIVDLHPRHPQVVLAAGFSGHGYTGTSSPPLEGTAVADLVVCRRTTEAIGLFAVARPARVG